MNSQKPLRHDNPGKRSGQNQATLGVPDMATHRAFPGECWSGDQFTQVEDEIAEEMPVSLLYNGLPHVVMMVTPRDLENFALGFSLSEAIVSTPDEVFNLEIRKHSQGIEVDLKIALRRFMQLEQRQRNLTGNTGCGMCGARTLEQAIRLPATVTSTATIHCLALQRAVQQLANRQPIHALTGSVHAAAWANARGDIELVREDIGRHNALDKLIGARVSIGHAFDAGVLLLTSRASYEMVQKAATVGIAIVAAVSAPTALAIRLAQESGVTLMGFTRNNRHTVYANSQRVTRQPEGLVA